VKTSGVTDALAEAVNFIFHHTTLNDDAIAARILIDYNLYTIGRQVRSIHLDFGWLRARSGARKAAQTAEVQHQVKNAMLNSPARAFGRRWFITYLRQQFSFRAGQKDVANAQRLVNANGVASRLPGLRKIRLKNYTTLDPNFLWCLDGYDKFL
jgi:hypothetical protein